MILDMASIDRHQYSEEIRKGAAKFVKDLNLDTGQVSGHRKSVNGDVAMLKKVSNNLSSKLEYFQKLDKQSVVGNNSSARRKSANNSLVNSSLVNGDHKSNGHDDDKLNRSNRSSIGAIASFALGDNLNDSSSPAPVLGLTKVSSKTESKTVTPLSRLPGQDLNLSDLVISGVSTGVTSTSSGVHTAQVARISNGHSVNGISYSRQSSVEKVECINHKYSHSS